MNKKFNKFEFNYLFADMKASLMLLVLCCYLLTVNADDFDDLFGITAKPGSNPHDGTLDFSFDFQDIDFDPPCPRGQKRKHDGSCQRVIVFR